MPPDEVRALAFFSLIMTIMALIFVNRTFGNSILDAILRTNRSLRWVLSTVALLLALILTWPVAGDLFRFGPLHFDDIVLVLGAGVVVLTVLEFLKRPWRTLFRG